VIAYAAQQSPRDLPRPWGFSFVSRKEINTALADPTMGGSALSGSPADFEMHHFYPRGAFYLACMATGVVLMLLFYFWSE
jgi:hypothetical protein